MLPEDLFLYAVQHSISIFDYGYDNDFTEKFKTLLGNYNHDFEDLEHDPKGNFEYFLHANFNVEALETILSKTDEEVRKAVVAINDHFVQFTYVVLMNNPEKSYPTLIDIISVKEVYPEQVTQTIYKEQL